MLTLCSASGIDFAKENTKSTRGCRNGFFFAFFAFFVAKNRVYPLAGRFGRDDLPVVREGCAAAQPDRTEYRSVTLGNGDVFRRTAIFPGIVRGARPFRLLGGASRAAPLPKMCPARRQTRRARRPRSPGIGKCGVVPSNSDQKLGTAIQRDDTAWGHGQSRSVTVIFGQYLLCAGWGFFAKRADRGIRMIA